MSGSDKETKPRYKAHYGKSQPVADDVMVEVYTQLGCILKAYANDFSWDNESYYEPIIGYRILEGEQ